MMPSFSRLALSACIALSLPIGQAIADESAANVFMNYSQEELDHNYTQSEWAPNIKQVLQRYDQRSELTRARLGDPETFAYGDDADKVESLDLFRATNPNAPVQVYIHGGAWRAGKAASYHFPADMFNNAGISYIALDFGNVQDIGLDGMMAQLRKAISWIYNNADQLGIDRNNIHISGHSSGAHLGGVLLTTDWSDFNLPSDTIKSATLISGMYDLEPVRLSVRSSYVPFNDTIEDQMSTARHIGKINTPIVLAYGGLETDEFQRQSTSFAEQLDKANKAYQLIKLEPYNHFEIMDDFGNPYNPIAEAALQHTLSPKS